MDRIVMRAKWRRPPTEADRDWVRMRTFFGPSVFERGREWLFIFGADPVCHADTPEGFERIN